MKSFVYTVIAPNRCCGDRKCRILILLIAFNAWLFNMWALSLTSRKRRSAESQKMCFLTKDNLIIMLSDTFISFNLTVCSFSSTRNLKLHWRRIHEYRPFTKRILIILSIAVNFSDMMRISLRVINRCNCELFREGSTSVFAFRNYFVLSCWENSARHPPKLSS